MQEQTLTEIIRQRIADDPRSVYQIARDAEINQPTLQRFAAGQRDMTGEPLGRLIAVLGGRVTWRKIRKK